MVRGVRPEASEGAYFDVARSAAAFGSANKNALPPTAVLHPSSSASVNPRRPPPLRARGHRRLLPPASYRACYPCSSAHVPCAVCTSPVLTLDARTRGANVPPPSPSTLPGVDPSAPCRPRTTRLPCRRHHPGPATSAPSACSPLRMRGRPPMTSPVRPRAAGRARALAPLHTLSAAAATRLCRMGRTPAARSVAPTAASGRCPRRGNRSRPAPAGCLPPCPLDAHVPPLLPGFAPPASVFFCLSRSVGRVGPWSVAKDFLTGKK